MQACEELPKQTRENIRLTLIHTYKGHHAPPRCVCAFFAIQSSLNVRNMHQFVLLWCLCSCYVHCVYASWSFIYKYQFVLF